MLSKDKTRQILPQLAFLAFVLVLLFSSNVHNSLFYRPKSVHQWRQADCTSQALNYHQNKISFWKPQMHNQVGLNGHAASEFPIYYYITGKLYDWFGFHEYFLRGLTLLTAIISWWFLYLFTRSLIGDPWLAFLPTVLLSTAPYYFFYANNFLPNVPALSFAIIGWYCFFKYWESTKFWWLYLMGSTMLLASLLKISEGISFVAILCLFPLSWFVKNDSLKSLFKKQHIVHYILVLILVLYPTIDWYVYAADFNKRMGNSASLLGTWSILDMTPQNFDLAGYLVFDVWWDQYHHPIITFLFIDLTVLMLVFWTRLHELLKWITLIILCGTFCYAMLWFKSIPMHDYYAVTFMIYPVLLLILGLEYLTRILQVVNSNRLKNVLYLATFGLSVFVLFHNAKIQKVRHEKPSHRSSLPEGSYELEPYLRSLGIKQTDRVYSVPDASPNVTLYLMNNIGFTEFTHGNNFGLDFFKNDKEVKYLIINDSSYLKRPDYQPYLKKQIGHYKGVNIYDLQFSEMEE